MKKFSGLLAGAMLVGLAGCGGLNGWDPSGDPMQRIVYTCSDGQCTPDEIILVAIAAAVSNEQIVPQFSGKVESAATGCAVYGPAYAAAGASQELFYAGADGGAAAGYGGITGCLGGAGNGLYTYSYAVDAVTGSATESALRDWENGTKVPDAVRKLFPNVEDLAAGVHAHASYIRTENKTADTVSKKKWTGPVVGSPVAR